MARTDAAAQANDAAASDARSYRAIEQIRHNGTLYGPDIKGKTALKLTDDQAAPLLAVNAIELSAKKADAPQA